MFFLKTIFHEKVPIARRVQFWQTCQKIRVQITNKFCSSSRNGYSTGIFTRTIQASKWFSGHVSKNNKRVAKKSENLSLNAWTWLFTRNFLKLNVHSAPLARWMQLLHPWWKVVTKQITRSKSDIDKKALYFGKKIFSWNSGSGHLCSVLPTVPEFFGKKSEIYCWNSEKKQKQHVENFVPPQNVPHETLNAVFKTRSKTSYKVS